MKRARRLLGLAVAAVLVSAHVGDTNTHFRGAAGPYTVRVTVRHPGVVPGLADITVRVEGGAGRRVSVRPVPSRQGLEGAPRPDVAEPVPGQPGLFAAELWFMTSGSYSVHVTVEGDAGVGTAVVPVASVATRRIGLGAGLGTVLIALGLFLAAGLVTIVRAAVGEAVLAPGELPDRRRLRRARLAAAGSGLLLVLLLTGGRSWWSAEDAAYRARMFRPLRVSTEVAEGPGGAALHIDILDREWGETRWGAIVPDHGKLMHAFLVGAPGVDVFAHIHPAALDADAFLAQLPRLPPGRYTLYADIVHESGFAQTLTDSITLPGAAAAAEPRMADPDDAWWNGQPSPVRLDADAAIFRFADGSTLVHAGTAGSFTSGEDIMLRFVATDADGAPTSLEPYMGMAAHAAVHRADGAVFVHLHPVGSISTAARAQLATRFGIADAAEHARHADDDGVIEIPYAFPTAGDYRVFVQTKRAGVVRTAAFDVEVK